MAHHILLLVSDTVERIRLRGAFAASGYRVTVASDPAELDHLDAMPHAVVAAPGPDPTFLVPDVRARLMREGREPPAIVGFGPADALTRLSAIRAGCADIVADTSLLRARLRDILRTRTTEVESRRRMAAARYLGLAEDRMEFRRAPRVVLVGAVPENVESATARRDDWRVERATVGRCLDDTHRGDVYLLGPGSDAGTLLPELRARRQSRRAAIVFLHEASDVDGAVRALDARASDAIPLDASGEEVALRTERALARKMLEERLRRQTDAGLRFALSDPLTGLHNRRYAEAYIAEMLEAGRGCARSFCAMMIDVDRFKEVNDTSGHAAGDAILKLVADVLRDNLRSIDLVARLGGDEFLVLMPDTLPGEAGMAAERLRARFQTEVEHLPGPMPVTLSIGVAVGASTASRQMTQADLIEAADRALYLAKTEGRNCVRLNAAA